MRYLKRTINLGLHYKRFSAVLEGYNDADWNTLSDDSKATNSYIFSIAGGAVSWKSKKQTILAQSTMERPIPAMLIHCDSTAAIAKIENLYYNGKK